MKLRITILRRDPAAIPRTRRARNADLEAVVVYTIASPRGTDSEVVGQLAVAVLAVAEIVNGHVYCGVLLAAVDCVGVVSC